MFTGAYVVNSCTWAASTYLLISTHIYAPAFLYHQSLALLFITSFHELLQR